MRGANRCITAIIAMLALFILSRVPIPATAQDEPLRVVTKPFPPLVTAQGESFNGFSIEFWDAIARQLGLDYEFYEVETVGDQIAAVQNGDADAAIAGITITEEREEVIDFTFPYFDSGLQIMVTQVEISPLENALRALLSAEMMQYLSVFLLFILIIAHAMWLIERRANPNFPRGYGRGIGKALWWSTVTAIGYDDDPPRSIPGRLLALAWMFAAIFLIASLTASLSAAATVRELRSDIRGISDLQGKRVVTVENTTSSRYLQNAGVSFSGVETIEAAFERLASGRADAVVYDAPVLRDYIKTSGSTELGLAGSVFAPERYGIALPEGSPHREAINRAILKLQEDGTYSRLYDRWFSVADN